MTHGRTNRILSPLLSRTLPRASCPRSLIRACDFSTTATDTWGFLFCVYQKVFMIHWRGNSGFHDSFEGHSSFMIHSRGTLGLQQTPAVLLGKSQMTRGNLCVEKARRRVIDACCGRLFLLLLFSALAQGGRYLCGLRRAYRAPPRPLGGSLEGRSFFFGRAVWSFPLEACNIHRLLIWYTFNDGSFSKNR